MNYFINENLKKNLLLSQTHIHKICKFLTFFKLVLFQHLLRKRKIFLNFIARKGRLGKVYGTISIYKSFLFEYNI